MRPHQNREELLTMAYELALFDDFVRTNFDGSNRTSQLTDEELESCCTILRREAETVLLNFRNRMFQFSCATQREFYVRQHQLTITRLKNRLVQAPTAKQRNRNVWRLAESLIEVLEFLLNFLKTEYPVYFDKEAEVPLYYLRKMQKPLQKTFERVQKKLSALEVDSSFQQAFEETVKPFLDDRLHEAVSFRLLDYLLQLFERLLNVTHEKAGVFFYSAFVDLMVGMNFNSRLFCNVLLSKLADALQAVTGREERLQYCLLQLRELERFATEVTPGLFPHAQSLRDALFCFYRSELFVLEYKPVQSVERPAVTEAEPVLHLTWTVEELGLYVRLLQDHGQLLNRNLRDVAKLLSGQVRTARKEQLSWQNLYNCFSKAEMNTMRSLDSKLVDVLNGLRRMKRG